MCTQTKEIHRNKTEIELFKDKTLKTTQNREAIFPKKKIVEKKGTHQQERGISRSYKKKTTTKKHNNSNNNNSNLALIYHNE